MKAIITWSLISPNRENRLFNIIQRGNLANIYSFEGCPKRKGRKSNMRSISLWSVILFPTSSLSIRIRLEFLLMMVDRWKKKVFLSPCINQLDLTCQKASSFSRIKLRSSINLDSKTKKKQVRWVQLKSFLGSFHTGQRSFSLGIESLDYCAQVWISTLSLWIISFKEIGLLTPLDRPHGSKGGYASLGLLARFLRVSRTRLWSEEKWGKLFTTATR